MEGEDGQSIEIRPRATELKDKGVGEERNRRGNPTCVARDCQLGEWNLFQPLRKLQLIAKGSGWIMIAKREPVESSATMTVGPAAI
ncbi:uncharacterized protein N7496_002918 [Penicillium cataractarum]|uniref:Uncharacterized protein n=1 Tax=Penicillium cataractarum TaxID=2100454 RepID=A0A9W9SM58_9EURO|nr:uncharacterized protein N7496_002918 [Penicillium cataractarum]KAJ5380490.1 hypothetical protein N7496_002918 [Penicillium cataractarum]